MREASGRASLACALRISFGAWLLDRAPTLAGALSFSTIFALAPLFVIIMALTGHFVSNDKVQQHLINQASLALGHDGATALQAMVQSARENVHVGTVFGIIGWVTLFGALSGVFLTLQDALNIIWHVHVKPDEPWLSVLRERVLALVMVFVMALVLIVTLATDASIAVVIASLRNNPSVATLGWALKIASTIFSLAALTVLFALVFKYLPQVKVRWRNVWQGAIVSAVLFVAGQWGIALLLQVAGLARGYGAAGSTLGLLLWIYVSAMFLFYGAEVVKFRATESA